VGAQVQTVEQTLFWWWESACHRLGLSRLWRPRYWRNQSLASAARNWLFSPSGLPSGNWSEPRATRTAGTAKWLPRTGVALLTTVMFPALSPFSYVPNPLYFRCEAFSVKPNASSMRRLPSRRLGPFPREECKTITLWLLYPSLLYQVKSIASTQAGLIPSLDWWKKEGLKSELSDDRISKVLIANLEAIQHKCR